MPTPLDPRNRLVGGSAGEPLSGPEHQDDFLKEYPDADSFQDDGSGDSEPYPEDPDYLSPDSPTSPPPFTTSNETAGPASTSGNGSPPPPPDGWKAGINGSPPPPFPGGSDPGGATHSSGASRNTEDAKTKPIFDQVRQRLDPVVLVPVAYGTKRAVLSDWPKKTLADMADPDYLRHFDCPVNLGALLGANSEDLVSIDVDSELDAAVFLQYNPRLAESFRSQARRGPNVFLRMDGDYPGTSFIHHRTEKEASGKSRHIGEFRSKGCMTIVAGRHPDGVDYRWIVDAPPLRIRFDQIVWPPDWILPAIEKQSRRDKAAQEKTGAPTKDGELSRLFLPNAYVTVSESAQNLFRIIGPSQSMFIHGNRIVEPAVGDDEHVALEALDSAKFRGRIQKFGRIMFRKPSPTGCLMDFPAMPKDDHAKLLMASEEARLLLPKIRLIVRFPVLTLKGSQVRVVSSGYDPETQILVWRAMDVPDVPLPEAVQSILDLFEEYEFESQSDLSRAVSALLSPALRLGEHIKKRVPVFVVEADDSQAGKGYLLEIIAAVYGEVLRLVTRREGGVGSVDESFDQRLLEAAPFIVFDNVRGKINSQHLEGFITCAGDFFARVPYHGSSPVDPNLYFIGITSNGAELTKDLANRSILIRIRKRETFAFREYQEGGLLEHVQARAGYFLGCVHSVILEWLRQGRPKTAELRHSFRPWGQSLDWIVQSIFGLPPLLDDHEGAQQRTANPALSFVRSLAIAVESRGQLLVPFTATHLFELVVGGGLDIPGLHRTGAEGARLRIGSIMAQAFGQLNQIQVDRYECLRIRKDVPRSHGEGTYQGWDYVFRKLVSRSGSAE